MKIIHSSWAKPYLNDRWEVKDQFKLNMFSYALSVLRAKQLFGNIDLVCDDISAKFFEILPYDNIRTDLNVLEDLNPRFWAYGKIKALSLYDEPVMHIDGDVMMVGKPIIDIVNSNYDVLVQMKEVGNHFTGTYQYMLEPISKACIYHDFGLYNFVYNCGIMGFKDLEFKNRYCHTFFRAIAAASQRMDIIDNIDRKYEINVVLEQSLLTLMATNENKYVKELLPLADMTIIGLEGLANRVGYAHLWGKSKYQPYWIQKMQARIYQLDPKLYYKILKHLESWDISN